MKLRSQVLLILFLFGLAPLIIEQSLNLPMVFSQLELFYHKAHLQNLRADFRDLDQHLASRHETLRLLARLPEFGGLLGRDEVSSDTQLKQRYAEWLNTLLRDRLDIVQVLFLDAAGNARFWVERDPLTQDLVQVRRLKDPPSEDFFQAGLKMQQGGVLTGSIRIDAKAGEVNPSRFMNLQLISPIMPTQALVPESADLPGPVGAVVVNIDIGGLAQAYIDTLWVHDNGDYLQYAGTTPLTSTAFEDYPGLDVIFAKGDLALWEGRNDGQIIWVPLLATERSGPLWVGRRVDSSPIDELRNTMEIRSGLMVAVLVLVILVVAHRFASRADLLRVELTNGIEQMLHAERPVRFYWQGPEELNALGEKLSALSEQHARNSGVLRDYAKELERSNQYKSEFLANVSHELRTPLNSILLLSKLLAESDAGLDDERMQQARVIHRAGQDLTNLINDILDLSRIDAGQMVFNVEYIRLQPLLEELVELFEPQTNAKGLALHLDIHAQALDSILSDADKLRQILKNFLANAVKFTHQGGIHLGVSPNESDDSQERPLRISVRDSGIGIPAAKHELIFQAFKQADGATTRRYGGTGLGLSISRELAEVVGGRIELESVEGRGATFSLILPEVFNAPDDEPSKLHQDDGPLEEDKPDAGIPEADYAGRRILLVDDDLRNLLALTPILEFWNLQVTAAGDGMEALETLEAEGVFDLVLMDIMMPVMDGYETTVKIRNDARFRGMPVVALTARAADTDQEKWRSIGGVDYLVKPVEPMLLKETLDRYFAHEKAFA